MDDTDRIAADNVANLHIAAYLAVAVVTAWTWDFIISIPDEVRILFYRRLSMPDVAYILARVTSGGFLGASLTFLGASNSHNCSLLGKIISWFGVFALPFNSMLFFLRVQAVFRRSPIIVAMFAFLWLSTLSAFTLPFGSAGQNIATGCVTTTVTRYSSVGFITVAIFDMSVFIMISVRLVSYGMADSFKERIVSFFSGYDMGQLSRAVLKTGQLYYLVTVGVNLFAVVSLLTSSFPPAVRAVLTMPNVALQNAMACRVYRLLKLGFIEEDPSTMRTSQLPEYEDTQSLRYITHGNTATTDYNTRDRGTLEDSINMMELTRDMVAYGRNRTFPAPLQISVNEVVEVAVEDSRWRPRTHRSV